MPRRVDIDPIDIPKLLPDLMLVDVLPAGRYRYRLIGTENAEAHGVHATGRYLDEVLPGTEYKAHVLGLYNECMDACRPLYSECLFLSPHHRRPERQTKVLFLPLSEDGTKVNQVLVFRCSSISTMRPARGISSTPGRSKRSPTFCSDTAAVNRNRPSPGRAFLSLTLGKPYPLAKIKGSNAPNNSHVCEEHWRE